MICGWEVTWKSALIVLLSGFHPLRGVSLSHPSGYQSCAGSCLDDAVFIYSHFDVRALSDQALIRIYQSGVPGFLWFLWFFLLFGRNVHPSACSQSLTQNFVRFLPSHTQRQNFVVPCWEHLQLLNIKWSVVFQEPLFSVPLLQVPSLSSLGAQLAAWLLPPAILKFLYLS